MKGLINWYIWLSQQEKIPLGIYFKDYIFVLGIGYSEVYKQI